MMDDGEVHWVARLGLQETNLGWEVGKLRLVADTQGEWDHRGEQVHTVHVSPEAHDVCNRKLWRANLQEYSQSKADRHAEKEGAIWMLLEWGTGKAYFFRGLVYFWAWFGLRQL